MVPSSLSPLSSLLPLLDWSFHIGRAQRTLFSLRSSQVWHHWGSPALISSNVECFQEMVQAAQPHGIKERSRKEHVNIGGRCVESGEEWRERRRVVRRREEEILIYLSQVWTMVYTLPNLNGFPSWVGLLQYILVCLSPSPFSSPPYLSPLSPLPTPSYLSSPSFTSLRWPLARHLAMLLWLPAFSGWSKPTMKVCFTSHTLSPLLYSDISIIIYFISPSPTSSQSPSLSCLFY